MKEKDEVLYFRFLKEKSEPDLAELISRHKERLIMFLYGFVRNMEDAEELAADTFALLATGTARYKVRKNSSFKTWLFAVGHNRARLHVRKTPRGEILAVPYKQEAAAPSVEDILFDDMQDRKLYLALEELKPEYRQVLYLLYFEEMSYEEISKVMKKNRKQVYNLAERGRTSLRHLMTEGKRE